MADGTIRLGPHPPVGMSLNDVLEQARLRMEQHLQHEQARLMYDMDRMLWHEQSCRCPVEQFRDEPPVQVHSSSCREPLGTKKRHIIIYEERDMRGDTLIGATFRHGDHTHPALAMRVSFMTTMDASFDVRAHSIRHLVERVATECSSCPRPPIERGRVAVNVEYGEWAELLKRASEAPLNDFVADWNHDRSRLQLNAVTDRTLAIVGEVLGLGKTEMWFFQDNQGLTLDIKLRRDMRMGGWARFPDGLTKAHLGDHPTFSFRRDPFYFDRWDGYASREPEKPTRMPVERCITTSGPTVLTVPKNASQVILSAPTGASTDPAKPIIVMAPALILKPSKPVKLMNISEELAQSEASNPHRLKIGDICPKCKKEWKERQLATSTFIGCMC